MDNRHIPKVDSMADNAIEGPFYMVSNKCVEIRSSAEGFDKIDPEILRLNITKSSFINQLSSCVKYINYFIKYFDDSEIITNYIMLIFSIKEKDTGEALTFDDFLVQLNCLFTSDTLMENIKKMVDFNMEGKKLDPPKAKTSESIQITEAHYNAIMFLSILYKCIIPITSTFYNYNKHKLISDGRLLTEKEFYYICFSMFVNKVNEIYEVDLYNKLYHTGTTRVAITHKDKAMWARRVNFGVSTTSQQSKLMKNLFVDLIQKAIFDKNAINLIHVAFDQENKHLLIQKDKYDIIEINTKESDEDDAPTKFDNLQMTWARFSLKNKSRAEYTIETVIDKLCADYDIEITDKMIEFYKSRFRKIKGQSDGKVANDIQINLIYLFFSKYVRSFNINNYMKTNWFIKVMIIFKAIYRKKGYQFLPILISGEIDRLDAKRFNKQQLKKLIENHPYFSELKDEYTFCGKQINRDKAIDSLRDLVVNKIYIIDHEYEEYTNEKRSIEVSENLSNIANEIVRFLLEL